MIEKNIFESNPGRPVHYFFKKDLQQHFKKFEVIEEGIANDPEEHDDIGYHIHQKSQLIKKNGVTDQYLNLI